MGSNRIAIIKGSNPLPPLFSEVKHQEEFRIDTPYGQTSSPIHRFIYTDTDLHVLHRHGLDHTIPPHKINYRANIWALDKLSINVVISINTVGGIGLKQTPGSLALPNQYIDYTWGRESTFFDGEDATVAHLEATYPYSKQLRKLIVETAEELGVNLDVNTTYAATQGPRFETPAEIVRLERDGCHIVGMTGVPEAPLAAEKGLNYACIALVVNPAAGKGKSTITKDEIEEANRAGEFNLNSLLAALIQNINLEGYLESEASLLS